MGRLKEFGYKNMWSTWIPCNPSPNHESERQQIAKLLLDRECHYSLLDHIITAKKNDKHGFG